ncbi:AAA family ATPase [Kocuria rhizophila]
MKLHRMEITAFGPFAGHESVDFDELNAAGVFLLNGETGSGKTSVLDAICFALYGTGPTTAAKGGRKAGHSDHADPHTAPRVDLEFTASGRRWHVSRTPAWREPSSRAASGWSERHATVLLRELVDGEWTERGYRPDDVGQMIHHAIGLDREQFTQVMMLPQGKFARFLQAGSKDREELLETLFGTDVYARIQDELKARADLARADLREADAEAERTHDQLERFRGRVADAFEHLPSDARESVLGHADGSSAEGLPGGGGRESAGIADAARDGGETSAPGTSQADGARPGHAEAAEVHWGHLQASCQRVKDALASARARAAEDHAAAQHQLAQLQHTHEQVGRYARLEHRRMELAQDTDRAETAAARLRDHQAASGLREMITGAQRAVATVSAATARVAQLREGLAVSSASGAAARQVLGDAATLLDEQLDRGEFSSELRDAVVAAREAARALVERAEAAQREHEDMLAQQERLGALQTEEHRVREGLAAARAELAETEQAHNSLLAGVKDEALVRDRTRAARDAVAASREYAQARSVEERCRSTYEQDEKSRRGAARRVEELEGQRYARAAASLAEELSPGHPCPVCGSTEHPEPASVISGEDVSAEALEKARAAREAAQAAADRSHAAWQDARDTASQALARGADPDLEAVVQRARAAEAAEAELDTRLSEVARTATALTSARDRVVQCEAELVRTAADVTAARTRAEAMAEHDEQERAHLATSLRGFSSAASFLESAEALSDAVEAWDTEHRALERARHEAQSAERAVAKALVASPFASEDAVLRAILEDREATELTAWHEEWTRDVARVEAELATQDMQRAARLSEEDRAQLTDDAMDRAAARCRDLEELRDRLTQHLGGVHALRRDLDAAAADVPAQEAAHRAAREKAERLGGLADVATATSSENTLRMTLTSFVLAAKLEHVAAVASEHLSRMSSGRFTLVHTDQTRGGGKSGLGLEIDDSWTGVRRGTESLSGGESFFTSLALALALADVVRAEAGGQEIDTLFVDEGFGSLDEQTLEQVLETLDGLRRDGRVIGVVSHVSEMKQRIDTQLVVTKTPQGSHLGVTAGILPAR